eukprot:4107325-Pyramimonas_sp.AAC.1
MPKVRATSSRPCSVSALPGRMRTWGSADVRGSLGSFAGRFREAARGDRRRARPDLAPAYERASPRCGEGCRAPT